MKVGAFIPLCDDKWYSRDIALQAVLHQTRKPDMVYIIANSLDAQRYNMLVQKYRNRGYDGVKLFCWSSWNEHAFVSKIPSIAVSRQIILMLANMHKLDYIWMVDSDIEPPEDALERMLAVDAVAVSAVCYSNEDRCFNVPYVFQWEPPPGYEGIAVAHFVRDLPKKGILHSDKYYTGFGCVLLKNVPEIHDAGMFEMQSIQNNEAEDLRFWRVVREKGIYPAVICDLHCKHHREDGVIAPSWLAKKIST